MSSGFDYSIDVVMCIDATGSMQPIIDEFKSNVRGLYQRFIKRAQDQDRDIGQLRVKVIVFRDYAYDAEPMVESRFFVLDDEVEELYSFVDKIEASGGGDGPENALEALAIAMKSDWVRTGTKRRHVIIMWTDAPALTLGARASSPSYPSDMPADMAELHEWWDDKIMDGRAKWLILCAPNVELWSDMSDCAYWPRVIHSYDENFVNGKSTMTAFAEGIKLGIDAALGYLIV